MSAASFSWRGQQIGFLPGETVGMALARAGQLAFGTSETGAEGRYFCGIGACQGCLVSIEGRIVEACLTPAVADMTVLEIGAQS